MISHEQFTKAYNDHYYTLYCFAWTILKNEEASKDVVHEAYIKLWRLGDGSRDLGKFLWVATESACKSYLRSTKNKPCLPIIDDFLPEEERRFTIDWIEASVMAALFNEIERLPKKCKLIFLLSLKGFKTEEIMCKMKLSRQNILNQKQRAIQILRASMSKYSFI